MATTMRLPLPPVLVKRVATQPEPHVNDVDNLTLEEAKAAIGRVVAAAIAGAALKEFGDKGQVSRWCQGENPNLAKLWQRPDVRRRLVLALAEESGLASVEVTVRMRA